MCWKYPFKCSKDPTVIYREEPKWIQLQMLDVSTPLEGPSFPELISIVGFQFRAFLRRNETFQIGIKNNSSFGADFEGPMQFLADKMMSVGLNPGLFFFFGIIQNV